jgi:hypothetical protein
MELNECFELCKEKNNNNYDACVISNLSNEYVHLYWTGPPTLTSNGKYMSRCSIKFKND